MSSPMNIPQGGMFVVTQMYPPPPPQGAPVGNPNPPQTSTETSTFSRAHPLVLGTVQMMIGLSVFLIGVVTAVTSMSLGVLSGFFVWGAGFYITAGSLTVAAGKFSNRCLMNTTLAFNIVAFFAAVTGICLYSFDTSAWENYIPSYGYIWTSREVQGMSGVMLVFHILEFFITIVIVAVLAKKSTCNCCNEQLQQQPFVYIIPGNGSMAPQAQASYYPEKKGVSNPAMDNVYQES